MKEKLTEHYRAEEDRQIEVLEYKALIHELAYKLTPFIKADVSANDMAKLLERFAPIGFLKIAEIATNGSNERNQLAAAIALVDRAGYRPIERSVNLEGDISKLSPTQLDSFLKNAFDRLPDQDKSKIVNLIQGPTGEFSAPTGNEIPNVTEEDIPLGDEHDGI